MHRLRKKSDPKKPVSPSLQVDVVGTAHIALPSPDDFRTSLILPDLSRRFSLLRSSSGEPVSVDTLRSRLADQRARGAENHVSEEEEDMILGALGFRSRSTNSSDQSSSIRSSSATATSSLTSSPSGRSTRRYSNNLFGSGRLRDYSYIRSTSNRGSTTTRTASTAPSDSSLDTRYANGLRPVTPEGNGTFSTQSSPEKVVQSAPLIPPAPYGEQPTSSSYGPPKPFNPRASRAVEDVIRELEEDVEDEILMPRSAPITRSNPDQHSSNLHEFSNSPRHSGVYEAGMAISPDNQIQTEINERRISPVPLRILPGYIPGMPRPMTPREDLEHDTLRSHSTTPRATSSFSPSADTSSSSVLPPGLASSRSAHSPSPSFSNPSITRQSSRPKSPPSPAPMFLQRSPNNGRFSPESVQRGTEGNLESSVPAYHRPVSPLSTVSYQPLAAVSSRPSTPSNVTWTLPTTKTSSKSTKHSRNASWFSDSESADTHASSNDHSKAGPRSLRSPALPDSPMIDRGHSVMSSISSGLGPLDNRPSSTVSGLDLSQSPQKIVRSPTPTQTPSRSPTSPVFSGFDMSRQGSRRSSKQNASSPFSTSPYNPIFFSPIANSSRSSLESVGSSYDSWSEDRELTLVSLLDKESGPPWHDISLLSQESSTGGSPDIDQDAEDVIGRCAGLRKSDFVAIQEKLVKAVKAPTTETRERAPSLRRRRPSTSQSNYSLRDIQAASSPPPQSPTPVSQPAVVPSPEQYSKASALLNSVVDSISSKENFAPPKTTISMDTLEPPSLSASSRDISPSTRRNRDLAQVLFGSQDDEEPAVAEETLQESRKMSPEGDTAPIIPEPSQIVISPSFSPPSSALSPRSPLSSYSPSRNPSQPRLPPEDEAELAREVQKKTEAAMMALKKRPSNSNLPREALAPTGSARKKINPNQISTPTLVSASTSVDTIPLRSPLSSGQPSKLGSRFKKLTGTLRKTNNIPATEINPYPLDIHSAPPQQQTQTVRYEPPKHPEVPMSANEQSTFNRSAVPIPSPPASAGPGLKGFMARFRGKAQRANLTDPLVDSPQRSPTIPYRGSPQPPYPSHTPQASVSKEVPPLLSQQGYQHSSSEGSSLQSSGQHAVNPDESIKQLFDAASNLGLDQQKLSELLVRSASTSSRSTGWTLLTRNNSTMTKSKPEGRGDSPPESASALGWSTNEELPVSPAQEKSVSRKTSVRQAESSVRQPENVNVRRPRPQGIDTNTIVRRTLIFPEKGLTPAEISAMVSKKNSRRRRASTMSATSNSSRSVHERVPTPPPARSSTSKRFSNDQSPPVPQLPQSLMNRGENQHLAVPSPVDKSSNYDSFYEMYAGDNKGGPEAGSSSHRETLAPESAGPALEFIELANGETIWSIVNGLRDDDVESIYTGRTSFASDYDNDEGVQVFVKDHTRSGSKGSNSSFISRKKIIQGKSRPETQVFYSSSAHIGALIENLSHGMDAGAFNFLPTTGQLTRSNTSSMTGVTDANLTMEERLEHLLGSMRTA
ncbi:hypothetical protein K435DRAFT_726332 [Dendrothele bispora CBS 962.96]|uniref:Uncharacterized protein n=1 Tax=Dendrothele bispora (strain CBS 962.96) TaxID=1314807 RepID=A0A4S8LT04_DENBC|nr:hypothetical protein K435DRAFT_759975 [Dendrothele bispora CBS 962.96]THU92163.1 hypothetical protein K435DRAFT_726332 [Dendrothele bispora CBS 962.96]